MQLRGLPAPCGGACSAPRRQNCQAGNHRQARPAVVAHFQRSAKRLKYTSMGQANTKEPLVIQLAGDGSDAWRLEPAVQLLKQGGVGIIPTDTLPALVADLENREAVLKLYYVKELDQKKPLSILVNRNFQQLAHYTAGFPAANRPGQPNWFNVVRRLLPGPYTFIMQASKNLPNQCIDVVKNTSIHRKSVGVRMPDDPVCQAFLEASDTALLTTSVHIPETVLSPDTEVPDAGDLFNTYRGKGVDFIIDVGSRIATQSTVVDMTGDVPKVVRHGRGDPTPFEMD